MVYSFFDKNRSKPDRILTANTPQGVLFGRFGRYLKKEISVIVLNCPDSGRYPISHEMIAEHYGNTIQLVLEWCFIREDRISRDTATRVLTYLLNEI